MQQSFIFMILFKKKSVGSYSKCLAKIFFFFEILIKVGLSQSMFSSVEQKRDNGIKTVRKLE